MQDDRSADRERSARGAARRAVLGALSRTPLLLTLLRAARARVVRIGIARRGIDQVAAVWGSEERACRTGGSLHWTELLQIQRRINWRVSGDANVDPYMYFVGKYLRDRLPVERALTLGCGSGELERHPLMRLGAGFSRGHDGFDIAVNAIERARAAAVKAGLTHLNYEVRDVNEIELPPEMYDCVWAAQSVHHFARLEHVFSQVRKTLKPGGWFVLNEFVGPSQFQWTDRQLEVTNGLLATLPRRLRRSCTETGTIKGPVRRPSVADMNRIDPSEAIRSSEILALLPENFDVVEVKGYGGAVLHPLLHEIAGNFQEADAETAALLNTFCEIEERLTAIGDLDHDFAFVIARKPSA